MFINGHFVVETFCVHQVSYTHAPYELIFKVPYETSFVSCVGMNFNPLFKTYISSKNQFGCTAVFYSFCCFLFLFEEKKQCTLVFRVCGLGFSLVPLYEVPLVCSFLGLLY